MSTEPDDRDFHGAGINDEDGEYHQNQGSSISHHQKHSSLDVGSVGFGENESHSGNA